MESRNQNPHQESVQENEFFTKCRIPFGYSFKPKDHELITYLFCKANGETLPCEQPIKEVDLYNMIDPGKLFQRTQDNNVYVFTKVKKVVENGKRIERKVTGNRTWKGVDKSQPIYNEKGVLVGEKRNFTFMNNMKVKLEYNMTEFVLDKGSLSTAKFRDYVVCKIKKRAKKGRNSQKDFGHTSISKEEEVNSSQNSLVTNSTIPFPQSYSEQYFSQNLLVSDAIIFPQSAADGQNRCQNSLDVDAISFPPEQCCQFTGLQEGTKCEEIASVAATGNTSMAPESFEASAQNQEQEVDPLILDMINGFLSSSPNHGIFP
ncbi:hypothetical protein M9H77_07225 [Catharanthus roseus]|uniref:Uncharacterized protein n=1 Tax=Catharanthus roseus TaxID=4058 RepID=A0ACC0BUH5_CATRO|nr:hypothetical protein M9H77_07225 [Catharanthus roseus]